MEKLKEPINMSLASAGLFTLLLVTVLVFNFELHPTAPSIFGDIPGSSVKRGQIVFRDELERSLYQASMENRTLIISFLNKAYANESGMLDLFLRSFRIGENTASLTRHILFVTVDQISYDRCFGLQLHCYKLVTEGVDFSKEVIYMSKDFVNMMWKRTLFLGEVLKRGYNFIFTDMDVMWLRNPFPRLLHEQEDLQISCDIYFGQPLNDSNFLNTGFYFARTSNRTIAMFDTWYGRRNNSGGMKEQDVLSGMKNTGVFRQLGVKVRYLDIAYFAGFCGNKRDFKGMVTLHANCCRTIKAKLADLNVVLEEWEDYRYNRTKMPLKWPDAKACYHSWRTKVGK